MVAPPDRKGRVASVLGRLISGTGRIIPLRHGIQERYQNRLGAGVHEGFVSKSMGFPGRWVQGGIGK